jgi:TolB-like protein/Tfp pilus assembly protein PilF
VKTSIAVLPFVDLSPHNDQEHLCHGIPKELIRRLKNVQNLWVPAYASSSLFSGEGRDIQAAGSKLNVETILTGTLQKSDKRLQIDVELVNVTDNHIIWNEKYKRNVGDIFDLQDDISLAVVDNLKLELLSDEKEKLIKRSTDNIEAYNLYLKGRLFFDINNIPSYKRALRCFKEVLELEPNFAAAYSGLADAYIQLAYRGEMSPREAYPKTKEYVGKALEIDDMLAEAYVSLASIDLYYDWDWKSSEENFRHAIALVPNNPTAHYLYSELLVVLGRFDEAMAEAKRAIELDPLSGNTNGWLLFVLYTARKYDAALKHIDESQEFLQDISSFHTLGLVNLQKAKEEETERQRKMNEEAVSALQRMVDLEGGDSMKSWLGYAYGVCGYDIKAKDLLKKYKNKSENEYVTPMNFVFIYIGLGEFDLAFEYLEKAYEERTGYLTLLNVDPVFDSLRSDPKFESLLERVGLIK